MRSGGSSLRGPVCTTVGSCGGAGCAIATGAHSAPQTTMAAAMQSEGKRVLSSRRPTWGECARGARNSEEDLMTGIIVVLIIVALIVVYFIAIYNGLVTARNAYKNAFAQIDVQLTRRHDLIPNLVETAKGYMAHERETLEAVVNARTAAVQAQSATGGTADDAGAVAGLAGAENV